MATAGNDEAYGTFNDKPAKDGEGDANVFVYSHGLTAVEAEERLKKYGPNCLPEKVTPAWVIFLGLLIQPMPIMIWLAAIIEAAIQNWEDFGILLFIQFANAGIAFYETTKAGDAVAALKASLKPEATVKRDGVWKKIDASICVPKSSSPTGHLL